MLTRDDIRAHVRPQVDALVDEIVERAWTQLQGTINEVIGIARSVLLEGEHVGVAEQVDAPSPRVSVGLVGSNPAPDTSVRASGRKPNSCKKCGAVGFTSATCGKTHNVGDSLPEALDRQMDVRPDRKPPPLSSSRSDRFAAIEAAAQARRG